MSSTVSVGIAAISAGAAVLPHPPALGSVICVPTSDVVLAQTRIVGKPAH